MTVGRKWELQEPRHAISRTSLRGLINDGMRNIGVPSEHEHDQFSASSNMRCRGARLLTVDYIAEVTDGPRNDKNMTFRELGSLPCIVLQNY